MEKPKISVGMGAYFTSELGGGIKVDSGYSIFHIENYYYGGGGFVFFDSAYIELNIGFFLAGGINKNSYYGDLDTFFTGLDFGLTVKYPLAVSNKLSIFPFLGVTYRLIPFILENNVEWGKADKPTEYSTFWIKYGNGFDYSFTDRTYLRAGVSYGIRIENKFEKTFIKYIYDNRGPVKTYLLGHGPEVKLAFGYRF